jgi:hypothetical protein
MRFMLYCDRDPRDLGIEDSEGNWDLERLREHIETCPECFRFNVVMGRELLDELVTEFRKKKGSQVNDRPQILRSPGEGERTDQ